MPRHAFAIGLLIFIMSLLVGGAAAAYFTDDVELTSPVECVMGTVEIDVKEKSDGGTIEFQELGIGEAKWEIANVGTKKVYIRAKLNSKLDGKDGDGVEDDPSAWAVGYDVIHKRQEDESSPRFGGGNARYNIYTLGYTEDDPLELKLGADDIYYEAGTVQVWDDGQKLYVEARTNDRHHLQEAHLYVGSRKPKHHAPGRLGYRPEIINDHLAECEVDLPKDIEQDKVYVALHAELLKLASGSGGDSDGQKPEVYIYPVKGWTKGDDGYYYYDKIVKSGESVVFKVRFKVEVEGDWSGKYELWIDVDAVQASHDAKDSKWPDNPI